MEYSYFNFGKEMLNDQTHLLIRSNFWKVSIYPCSMTHNALLKTGTDWCKAIGHRYLPRESSRTKQQSKGWNIQVRFDIIVGLGTHKIYIDKIHQNIKCHVANQVEQVKNQNCGNCFTFISGPRFPGFSQLLPCLRPPPLKDDSLHNMRQPKAE